MGLLIFSALAFLMGALLFGTQKWSGKFSRDFWDGTKTASVMRSDTSAANGMAAAGGVMMVIFGLMVIVAIISLVRGT